MDYNSSYPKVQSKWIRKPRSVESYDSLVMIRNENFPCKVLSVCENKLCFKLYDEHSLINQLWVWENGYLQHRATYKYVARQTETETVSLQNELPSQAFTFSDHHLYIAENNSCTVFVGGGDNDVQLKLSCQKKSQVWSFTKFHEVKNSIASFACLFLIQDIETCSVVTPESSDEMPLLITKPIDDNDMINQVWQWDQQYIRHYNTKLYLTSGSKDASPRALSLERNPAEKWVFRNYKLHTFGSAEESSLDTTKGKVTLHTGSDSQVNLTKVNENDVLNCETRGRYFAIRHTEEPCKVLCAKSKSVGPDSVFLAIAVGFGFVTGALLGLISVTCTEHNKAVKIAFTVGISFATVSAAVIEYSSLFRREYQTIQFKYFSAANPLTCLWHDYTGKLRNADNNKSFYLESSSNGIDLAVRLFSETDQTWLIRNGTITGKSSTTCDINLKGNEEHVQSNTLLFSCEETASKNASWTKVYDDGTINFKRQVICMYFLQQTNEKTCTFLTARKNLSAPIAQVDSNEHLLNQVWYTSGDSVENVGTGVKFSENIGNFEKVPFDKADDVINVLTNCQNNMFFIQSENFPCKLLTVLDEAGRFILALHEYSIEMYFNQLWTNLNGHLYNIGTGTRLAIHSSNSSSFDFILSNSDFIQYDHWSFENKTIKFTRSGCSVSAIQVNGDIEIHCKTSTQSQWNMVPFDENFTYLKRVLCTFFIQNQNPPCAFLTANRTKEQVFLEYMGPDVIDEQLWFMSDGRLINLRSGMPLDTKSQGNEITLGNIESGTELQWSYQNEMLQERNSKEYLTGFASVRLAAENEILVSDSKFWNIINSDMILEHLNMFTCQTSTTKFFFLKNQLRPCELLTATNKDHLAFKVFDEAFIEKQLWYIENGRLFNAYTGNVLKFVKDKFGFFNIELSEMLIYDTEQIIYSMHDKLVHVYNTTHECFLSYVERNGNSSLTCKFTESKASEWKRIVFNEEMRNADELICLFFLKNKLAPCDVLTGYEENEDVKVRPRIKELIEDQLFYWRNKHIVHMKTGLLLTASIDSSSKVTLQQEGIETEIFYQRWSALGSQIVPLLHYYLTLEVNTYIDGNVILTKSDCDNQNAWSQQWLQEPFYAMKDTYVLEPENECVEEKVNNTVFFIRNKAQPCLVLAGSEQGSMPHFEVFDPDDIELFLWIYDNHHIMNFKTGLALMMDYEEGSYEHGVIMWQYYAFSLAQKWTRNKDGIYHSGLQSDCFLHSDNYDDFVTIQSKCIDLDYSDLEILKYDENADVISNLTCTFFIKSNAKHCELLTHIGGNQIRTRPLLTGQVLHQLWYWKGSKLVNYGTNGVVIISNSSNTVTLQNSYDSQFSWLYSYSFLKSQQLKNAFITISDTTGEIVIDSILQTSYERQQWILIDKDQGIDDPSYLICNDSFKDKNLYVVRSEHDSCPLLTVTESGSIGVSKMSDSFTNNGLWLKDNSHIFHINQRKCLSVKESVVRGTRVFLQQKYFYEKLQQWSTDNDRIKSKYTNHSQYLTYTGSKVAMVNSLVDHRDKQRWKWYTVGQIESNDKLLRCSRCYNKGEETAAEVIAYFPVFGWLYNLGRSIAYGAKNCPDIAISSLVDGIIDVAFDVLVALSAGTASALAYGVKTGLKLGIKAGINAVKTAIKSMIKVTFKSMKSSVIKFARRGLKKTIKKQLTKMHIKSKFAISSLKQRLVIMKSLKDSKMTRLKSLFTKKIKFPTVLKDFSAYRQTFKYTIGKIKTSLKNFPRSVKRKAEYIQSKVKEKLKQLGNSLVDKAERSIRKADDFSRQVGNIYHRCKRVVGSCFRTNFANIKDYNEDLPQIPRALELDLQELSRLEVLPEKGQVSSIGLKQDNTFIITKQDNIANMQKSDAKPEYKPASTEAERGQNGKQNVRHTEQHLFQKIDHTVVKDCNPRKPCEVFLYTKMSPCYDRLPPSATPCLEYLTKTCKAWYEAHSTKCFIVFKNYYGKDTFTGDEDDSLAAIFGRTTHQKDVFEDELNDVTQFAMALLDDIESRKFKISQILKFSPEQSRVFDQSVSDATQISKTIGISSFWDNLFSKIDFGTVFKDKQLKDVERQVKIMIRESLNTEAKKRLTVRAINDMKTNVGANDAIVFYRI